MDTIKTSNSEHPWALVYNYVATTTLVDIK